jgi:hypothetical protein
MAETIRRSRWRIGHLVGGVAASAFVLALVKFPQEYALPLVSVAGFLVIGSCVIAAIANETRDRSATRPGRSKPTVGGWMVAAAPVAVLVGLGFGGLERYPSAVLPTLLILMTLLIGSAVLLVTWFTASDRPAPDFRRLARRNLSLMLVVIAATLVVVALMMDRGS